MVVVSFYLPFTFLFFFSFSSPISSHGSGSCSLWTLPDIFVSGYALPQIYRKLSPPLYIGAVTFFLCISFFHSQGVFLTQPPFVGSQEPAAWVTSLEISHNFSFWFLQRLHTLLFLFTSVDYLRGWLMCLPNALEFRMDAFLFSCF